MKIKKKIMKKGGEFKPHMMFDPKTGKGFKANKMADHLRMDKMGYLHEDEMKKKGKKMDKSKKGAKGMMYKKAKGGMKIQYKMQEGGKNPIAKDEDYTLMYQVDDQKMSGGRKIPETKVTGEEIKNLYQRNKIFPSEERYFQSQLKELGISEPIKNLVTTGRLESEIKKAKKSLAEKKSKELKKEMMEQVNQPSQDRLKSGKKGMKYNEARGGMKVQYKMMKDGGKNGDNQKVYSANEISKMSMKELAEILNGIADSKSKNKDFKHKGLILGNTANTIKLIRDEVKMRMKNMTPEQMKKMMGVGEGAADAVKSKMAMGGMMKKMMAGGMMKKDDKMMMMGGMMKKKDDKMMMYGGKMKTASYGMRLKKKSK